MMPTSFNSSSSRAEHDLKFEPQFGSMQIAIRRDSDITETTMT